MLAALSQNPLDEKTESGIITAIPSDLLNYIIGTTRPENAKNGLCDRQKLSDIGKSDINRISGVVLAVGDPPRIFKHDRFVGYDYEWTDLEFGDLVECSAETFGHWFAAPIYKVFADYNAGATRVFAPEDGGPERFTLTNQHLLAFVRPRTIICRWSRRDWTFHKAGERPYPRPIADRVMVRNLMKRPEETAGGLILPHLWMEPERIGEVVSIGREVDELGPGDWAFMEHKCGTQLMDPSGQIYTFIHESDILGRWDTEPNDEEKRCYGVELIHQ